MHTFPILNEAGYCAFFAKILQNCAVELDVIVVDEVAAVLRSDLCQWQRSGRERGHRVTSSMAFQCGATRQA